jgi:hypothetical protein
MHAASRSPAGFSRLVRWLVAMVFAVLAFLGLDLRGQNTSSDLAITNYSSGSATADVGQPLRLVAGFYKPNPEVTYTARWTHDGVVLPATSTSFSIPSVAAADAGIYECTLLVGGTATGFVARGELRVLAPRVPVLGDPVSPLDRYVGDTASLDIAVQGGTWPFTFTWYRDGNAISSTNDSRLTLPNFTTALAGTYTVTVTNAVGSTTSRPIVLRALAAILPVLSPLSPADAGVAEGADVVLNSDVTTSSPPLSYQWFKNGVAVGGATDRTLRLSGVTRADAGSYSVAVTNPAGTTSSRTAKVTVGSDAPLQVRRGPESAKVLPGAAAAFWLDVVGGPPVRYQWLKDGQPLPNATQAGYRIDAATSADIGRYSVVATNDVGSVTAEATLGLLPPIPDSPAGMTYFEEAAYTNSGRGAEGAVLRTGGELHGIFSLTPDLPSHLRAPLDGTWRYLKLNATSARFIFENAEGVQTLSRILYFRTESSGEVGDASANSTISGHFLLKSAGETAPMVNTSNRSFVRPGGTVIAGFVLTEASNRVLVRAVGPGLAAYGVSPVLEKPVLRVYSGQTVVSENQGWTTYPPGTESLRRTADYVGAFPLVDGSADSALIANLPAGAYTANVSGAGATDSGEVLVEVYLLR